MKNQKTIIPSITSFSFFKILPLCVLLIAAAFYSCSKKSIKDPIPSSKNSYIEKTAIESRIKSDSTYFLESVCSNKPDQVNRWKFKNTSALKCDVYYYLPNSNSSGFFTSYPNSEKYFETDIALLKQECVLLVNGQISINAFSLNQRCLTSVIGPEKSKYDEVVKGLNSVSSLDYNSSTGLNASGQSLKDEIITYGKDFYRVNMQSQLKRNVNYPTLYQMQQAYLGQSYLNEQNLKGAFRGELSPAGMKRLIELTHLVDSIQATEFMPSDIVKLLDGLFVDFESKVEFARGLSESDKKTLLSIMYIVRKIDDTIILSGNGMVSNSQKFNARKNGGKILGQVFNTIIYTGIFTVVGVVGGAASGGPVGAVIGGIGAGGMGLLASACANGWVKNCNLFAYIKSEKINQLV